MIIIRFFSTFSKYALIPCVSFLLICFADSCKNPKADKDKPSMAVIDTTPLGKEIGEISLKIGADPSNANLYNERAKLHLKRMDVANAMMDMSKVMELDTTKADYFLTLADVHFAANKSGKSKAALEKCLSLDPTNIKAQEKLSELYFYVRKYDESIAYLDKILKSDIHNAKAYFMKGMNYKEKGDTTKAISSFQTAIEQRQDYYDAYQQLGMIYLAKSDPLAFQYYEGALRINPRSEEALYGRAMYYQEVKHDYDKAIQDYTSILQINPKNASADFALGFIHYQYLKVYDESIKHYSRAIVAAPDWPEAVFNRGLAYETLGNISAAKVDYQKALELRPDYVNAQKGLERVK